MSAATGDKTPLAAALGRVPSGLFILTATRGTEDTGMLTSWVQQCGFDPPQVSVAVAHGRPLLAWLTDGAPFALNVLAEGQTNYVKHFGRGFEAGQPAFTGLAVTRTEGAAPTLDDAHAHLFCRVTSRTDVGDHVLIVGEVTAGAVKNEAKPATHVRKNGFVY